MFRGEAMEENLEMQSLGVVDGVYQAVWREVKVSARQGRPPGSAPHFQEASRPDPAAGITAHWAAWRLIFDGFMQPG